MRVYEEWGTPRHPNKAVSRSLQAEVQGAIIDGQAGIAYPKLVKVYKGGMQPEAGSGSGWRPSLQHVPWAFAWLPEPALAIH